MCMTDEAITKLCEAMRERHGAGIEFELALGDLVGRYRRAHDAAMRDQEAARLLPMGPEIARNRLGVATSTLYKMTHRHLRRCRSTVEGAA